VIFVTVGSQIGFDRFVRTVDEWAAGHPGLDILCQYGSGSYVPRHMRAVVSLDPAAFEQALQQASLLVAHAGIGSILSAASARKPLIIFPRHGSLRETRNDHQLATAKWMMQKAGVQVAWDEAQLHSMLEQARHSTQAAVFQPDTPDTLIGHLRHYIFEERAR